MEEEKKSISISSELYQELRSYCDLCGIRFADFVQEVLEAASYGKELEHILNNEKELKKRMGVVREFALREGFSKGVLATVLLLQGNIQATGALVPDEILKMPVFEPVAGEQRSLFD